MENQIKEVVALTTVPGHEPYTFTGEQLSFSSKRTSPGLGQRSPVATLYLYKNHPHEGRKPSAKRRYVVTFEKREANGNLIVASYRSYPSLEKAAEKSPNDKMHRRLFKLVGMLDHMLDAQIETLGDD